MTAFVGVLRQKLFASNRSTAISAVLTVLALAVTGPYLLFWSAAFDHRYSTVDVPSRPVALVFGAGLNPDGRPSAFLAQRLDAAADLWRRHKVQHVLVSGDNSTTDYDEVDAMRTYLIGHGVPERVITRDYAGFDTFDSCYRAKHDFGVTGAILVTQDYHLARALWTCRHEGIDAVGVGPSRWSQNRGLMVKFQLRELVSDAKAVWQTEVDAPAPTFPDKPEVLN